MPYVNTSQSGQGMAPGNNVCLTPTPPLGIPAPVPYPSVAMKNTAVPTCYTQMVLAMPILNMGATIPVTTGDAAGVMGGVMSGTFSGPARCTMGSTSVFINGMPITKFSSPTMQNATNAVGTCTVPSQNIYQVLT